MAHHSLFRDHEYVQHQHQRQLDSDLQSISSKTKTRELPLAAKQESLHTPQHKQENYQWQPKQHHCQPSTSQSSENDDRDRSENPKHEETTKQTGTQIGSSPQNDGSTVAMGKPVLLRKLNAQAPEFVPRGGSSSLSPLQGPTISSLQQNRKSSLPHLTIPQKPNPQLYSASRLPSHFSPISSQVGQSSFSFSSSPRTHSHLFTAVGTAESYGDHEASDADDTASGSSNSLSKGGFLTEELRQKIVKQVEYYFSDANLSTNDYLMKFVKKDLEGFVPIPVIASFKKVRSLVTNYAVVTAALRTSSLLVVSEDGKKVKRASPMSDTEIEELQSRTVVAENLPENHSNENIEKVFATVGTVKMVHICHPQAVEPSSPLGTRFTKSDTLVSNKLHALVEYESVEQAEKAVAELNDERNWRSGLRVRLLLRRTGKPVNQLKGRKVGIDNTDGIGEDEVSTSETVNDKHLEDCPQHADFLGEEQYSTDKEKEGGKKGRGRGRGRGHGRSQYHNGRSYTVGLPQSPNSTVSEIQCKQPPGPRMPDGTRGFTMGRGKPLHVATV